jgi:transposase InsO family protein
MVYQPQLEVNDMPWKEVTTMSQKKEFITLALNTDANMSQLCRRFGISRKTGYKWIVRYKQGDISCVDYSRKPFINPNKTSSEIEDVVLKLREKNEHWGGRKLRRRMIELGYKKIPAASTITAILRRHGKIDEAEALKHKPWQRFEAKNANDLWQMDFKGDIEIINGRCYPLTVLDDHSRFSLGIRACNCTKGEIVKEKLINIFRKYGIPKTILVDNGAPWGTVEGIGQTRFSVWLMKLGIQVWHSRPRHPQTLGKDERFHRTMKLEVLNYCYQSDLKECQNKFDKWRVIYNTERPHESLGLDVPASRYKVSERSYFEKMPSLEYEEKDEVRKVIINGLVSYKGKRYRVGKAFVGEHVALRPTENDGIVNVVFGNQRIAKLDLKNQVKLV